MLRQDFTHRQYGRLVAAGLVGLGVVLVALMIPENPGAAIAIALGLLAAGIILTAPALLLAAVFATTYAYFRVGPSSVNMSLGDAVTVLALIAALPFVPWHNRWVRRLLAGLAFYLGLILIAVLAHATDKVIAEWLHRGVLYGGTLLIGAAAADRKQTKLALSAFVYAGAFVAVAAIVDTISIGFGPAYPFGMHKNGAGPLMAMGVIILTVAPGRLEMRPSWIRNLRVLLVLGVFATQSRGAGLALVAVIAYFAMRHREVRRRAPVFFLTVSLALIIGSVVTLQAEQEDNPKFNGIDSRETTYNVALGEIWANHPILGGGMRWFENPNAQAGVPHDLVVAELSENGLLGLLGVLVLIGNTLLVLIRRRDPIGEAGFLVFVFEVLFGLTGIFWVAGTFTLPMLLVGLAVGDPNPVTGRPRAKALASPSP